MKMKSTYIAKWLILAVCFLLLSPFSALARGSKSKAKGGPPSHAPAHGHRAKYKYHYYPKANVYYDASRNLYFYIEGDKWRAAVSLPLNLKLNLGGYVSMKMESDRPYQEN